MKPFILAAVLLMAGCANRVSCSQINTDWLMWEQKHEADIDNRYTLGVRDGIGYIGTYCQNGGTND